MRTFESGATRDSDENKLDYEGFLSPQALEAFAMYMHRNRVQADGGLRDSDNWQKGMPRDAYMKSMWRHFMEVWKGHRQGGAAEVPAMLDALCALMFNVQGYLHEYCKGDAALQAAYSKEAPAEKGEPLPSGKPVWVSGGYSDYDRWG